MSKSKKPAPKRKEDKTKHEKDMKLKQKETERVERETELIKVKNQGTAGNVFRIRKSITGPKKSGQEASSIKDPSTGELLVTKDDIKRVTVKYCAANLKGNKPNDKVETMVKQRRIDQLKKMEEECEVELEIDHDDFIEVIEKFKRKPTKTYDFLIKAGKRYQQAVYKLCNRIIN